MTPNAIERITVIGPGMMGHAIAQEFAAAGHEVILHGRSRSRLDGAMENISRNLEELVQWKLFDDSDLEPALERLQTTTDIAVAADHTDLVIESVVEELEIKEQLFRELDERCPQHTILASNTSTLLPSSLAAATKRPDRFLVAHYFNPAYLMPLVEIVRGTETSEATVQAVYHLMKSVGKQPIICQKEALGFIANRLQLVLWREAFNIVQRGIASPQDVDTAVKNSFGRRMGIAGPFEIFEHNDGYDLTLQCEKYMLPDMDTSPDPYPLLLEKVKKGELGAKSGKGFYEWTPEFTQAWRRKMLLNLVGFMKSGRG
jgi:3-hydroxyacyl-CoA dehydrogenase